MLSGPLEPGLVTPKTVIATAVPSAILRPLESQHSRLGSVRREQAPTAVPPTVTVPPVQLARLVPVGKAMVMRLLASSESAPVEEVVNASRYEVRPPAALVGVSLATATPVSGCAAMTASALVCEVVSDVVESVKVPLAPGLVTPSNVMLTAVSLAMVRPLERKHSA